MNPGKRNLSWSVCIVLLAAGLVWAKSQTTIERTVQVKQMVVRESPAPFSKRIGVLEYGEFARVVDAEPTRGYVRVQLDEQRMGWAPASALTAEKVELLATETVGTEVAADEVAMAKRPWLVERMRGYEMQQRESDAATGAAYRTIDAIVQSPAYAVDEAAHEAWREAGELHLRGYGQ